MSLIRKIRNANQRFLPGVSFFGPEWLVLGVNNVCNLHCKMCDVGLKNSSTNFAVNLTGSKPLNMPLELIKEIIDQAHSYYPKVKLGYAFTEPLVYPHLIESLNYAHEKGMYTTMTTNGLYLAKKAEDLAKAGLKEIFISLDGPEEIHNEIRGNARSFQTAVEGIKVLGKLPNSPAISVYCVITEWNIGHLVRFMEYFRDLPVKTIGFMHANYTTDTTAHLHNQSFAHSYPATSSNTDEMNFDNLNLDILWKEMTEIKSNRYPFSIEYSPDITSRERLDDFYYKPEIKFGKSCNDIHRNIMIKSDGSVIPAHGRCYNLTIGNLYKENLKEIWHSRILSNFKQTLQRNGGLLPACTRCCSAF